MPEKCLENNHPAIFAQYYNPSMQGILNTADSPVLDYI